MAMDADDLDPRAAAPQAPDLEKMSLEELREYVAGLQREISRAEEMIASKQDHRSSADKLFNR